jgi:uncharacterized glyoxalase superfamily protein PhnB
MSTTTSRPSIVPTLRYKDGAAAVEWLCRAFGFERRAVYADEAGVVHHAELLFGNGMVMVGTQRDDEFGALQAPPRPGEPVNQSAYVIVADADAHHARALAHGALVVYALRDEGYGGRGYSCRDPEGHLWNFGTYDPWAATPTT